jgi:uncharacterized RDD family membrane protein YckC
VNPRQRTDPGLAFNERTAAFLLDYLILGGAAFLAGGGGLTGLLALEAVTLVNQGILGGLTGYSLGKAITGVRAARVEGTDPPGIVAGLLRWLLLNVDILFFGLVGLFVSSRSPRRQRVGDIVARTWVVGGAPAPRYRSIAGAVLPLLTLAFIFVRSTEAGWAVAGVFVPVAVGAAVIVSGMTRRVAPWPWLVGLGVSLVPACYMASVKLCDKVAGACISGNELSNSQQAIVSVIAFVAAIGVLAFAPRSRSRDIAFRVLVLFGQVWLVLRLIESHERAGNAMVIALIVIQLSYEVLTRVRAAREGDVPSPAVAA